MSELAVYLCAANHDAHLIQNRSYCKSARIYLPWLTCSFKRAVRQSPNSLHRALSRRNVRHIVTPRLHESHRPGVVSERWQFKTNQIWDQLVMQSRLRERLDRKSVV